MVTPVTPTAPVVAAVDWAIRTTSQSFPVPATHIQWGLAVRRGAQAETPRLLLGLFTRLVAEVAARQAGVVLVVHARTVMAVETAARAVQTSFQELPEAVALVGIPVQAVLEDSPAVVQAPPVLVGPVAVAAAAALRAAEAEAVLACLGLAQTELLAPLALAAVVALVGTLEVTGPGPVVAGKAVFMGEVVVDRAAQAEPVQSVLYGAPEGLTHQPIQRTCSIRCH